MTASNNAAKTAAKTIKLSSAAKAVKAADLSTMNAKQCRILKKVSSSSMKFGKYDHIEDFMKTAVQYIQGVRQRRVISCVHSVAPSGMSRKASLKMLIKCSSENSFNMLYLNAFAQLVTGDKRDKDGNIILTGCGFDVVWDLNYRIINSLCYLGFISKKECAVLAQQSPHNC